MPPAVCKLGVNLIGNDRDISIFENLGYLLYILRIKHRTGGIVRERQNECLCSGCYRFFQLLSGQLESVLALCVNCDRNGAEELCHRLIAYI